MSQVESPKHSIGDEIPYRRDQIDKRTGSLVFDKHLEKKLTDDGEPAPSAGDAPLK